MIRPGILYLTAVCFITGCGTITVVQDTKPTLPPAEVVLLAAPSEEDAEAELIINEDDVEMLAKLVWGEARGCSTTEQAAVIWTVLNRVDSEDPLYPDTIEGVVTQPWQFIGYDSSHPAEPDKVDLAKDVLTRWLTGGEGRVLPKEYIFFHGDGIHNHFRTEFEHNGQYWDWSLDSPYEE